MVFKVMSIMMVITMVMLTPRPLYCLTLVCAKEEKDICCTSGKLSDRRVRRRWPRKGKGGRRSWRRVKGEARGRRRAARHSCGLENLRLHLPRQGCFLLCHNQESSEVHRTICVS